MVSIILRALSVRRYGSRALDLDCINQQCLANVGLTIYLRLIFQVKFNNVWLMNSDSGTLQYVGFVRAKKLDTA